MGSIWEKVSSIPLIQLVKEKTRCKVWWEFNRRNTKESYRCINIVSMCHALYIFPGWSWSKKRCGLCLMAWALSQYEYYVSCLISPYSKFYLIPRRISIVHYSNWINGIHWLLFREWKKSKMLNWPCSLLKTLFL